MKTLIKIVFLIFSLGMVCTETIKFTLTGINADGSDAPIKVYPGSFTEFYVIAKHNSTKKFLFQYVNFKIDNSELPDIVFDETIQKQIPTFNADRIKMRIGLKCDAEITEEMLLKTYALKVTSSRFEENNEEAIKNKDYKNMKIPNEINEDDIIIEGNVVVEIGGLVTTIKVNQMQTELRNGTYSFIKFGERLFPTEEIYITCNSSDSSATEDGMYCRIDKTTTGYDGNRFLPGYPYYDTWNGIEGQFGSEPGHEINQRKRYSFSISAGRNCYQFLPKTIDFYVDPKTPVPDFNFQVKKDIAKTLEVLPATVASTVKFSFNLPIEYARIDCGAYVNPPFTDYAIWNHEYSQEGDFAHYTNFYDTPGKVTIDMLCPRGNYDLEFKIKCYVRNTVEDQDNSKAIYFILGRWFASNYPNKLVILPPFIPPKIAYYEFDISEEQFDYEKAMGEIQGLSMHVLQRLMAGNPDASSPLQNGCIKTGGEIQSNREIRFFFEFSLTCDNIFKGDASKNFLNGLEGIKTTEDIEKVTGITGMPFVKMSYDINEGFSTAAELIPIKVNFKNTSIIFFNIHNPTNTPKNIYYDVGYEYKYVIEAAPPQRYTELRTIEANSDYTFNQTIVTGPEEKLFSIILGVIPQHVIPTVFESPYIGITTMINRDKPSKEEKLTEPNAVNCTEDRNHIECIKKPERPFIDYLSVEDEQIQRFYYYTQGFSKIDKTTERDFYIEQQMKFAEGTEVEDNIEFLFNSFKTSKLLSAIDCQKETDFKKCQTTKQEFIKTISSARTWLFDCQKAVQQIKGASRGKAEEKDNYFRRGLTTYLLTLTNIAKNPEAFDETTTKSLLSTSECLQQKIDDLIKGYKIEEVDIYNLIPALPAYLAEALQYDLANGFIKEEECTYKEAGLCVSEITLKIKELIEEAIRSKIQSQKIIDLGNTYTHVSSKLIQRNAVSTLTFPKSEIKIKVDPTKIYNSNPDASYIEATIYYNYPLISSIKNTVSASFIKMRVYNKDGVELSNPTISEPIEVYFPKNVDTQYVGYSDCYHYDPLKKELSKDKPAENAEEGKYALCKFDFMADYTIGGLKKPDPDPDPDPTPEKSSNALLIVLIIIGVLIVLGAVGFFVFKYIKKNRKVDLPEIGGKDQELLTNLN